MLVNKLNMKLSKQVCSLELAKKLKELGAEQDSLFWWQHQEAEQLDPISTNKCIEDCWYITNTQETNESMSAFTVAELGEMLPHKIIKKGVDYYYETGKTTKDNQHYKEHEVLYSYADYEIDADIICHLASGDTEADARARMLIYLLENKLI